MKEDMDLYRSRLSFSQNNEGSNLSVEVETVCKSASDLAVYCAEKELLDGKIFICRPTGSVCFPKFINFCEH